MLMGVLMSISKGGVERNYTLNFGDHGGLIICWSHFCRPFGGQITQ